MNVIKKGFLKSDIVQMMKTKTRKKEKKNLKLSKFPCHNRGAN